MTEETSKIRIDSAQALFEALRSGDPNIQGPVLAAVAAAPAKAASYGSFEGRDLIDELIESAGRNRHAQERLPWLEAVAAFEDQRARDYLERVFAEESDPQTLDLCARVLSRLSDDEVIRIFRPHLADDRPPHKIQFAADALAGRVDRQPVEVQIRTAVWSTKETAPPSLDEGSREAWLAELAGARFESARWLLEVGGSDSFSFLLNDWDRLDERTRLWLLEWADRAGFERLAQALDAAWADPGLAEAALRILVRRPDLRAERQTRVDQLADSDNPDLRRGAVLAGATVPNIDAALTAETDPIVRCALLKRLESRSDQEAADLAAAWCLDEDHRVRASAMRALAAQGEPARRWVDEWAGSENVKQQAAAWYVRSRLEPDPSNPDTEAE